MADRQKVSAPLFVPAPILVVVALPGFLAAVLIHLGAFGRALPFRVLPSAATSTAKIRRALPIARQGRSLSPKIGPTRHLAAQVRLDSPTEPISSSIVEVRERLSGQSLLKEGLDGTGKKK